jgi:hypothetical protein
LWFSVEVVGDTNYGLCPRFRFILTTWRNAPTS